MNFSDFINAGKIKNENEKLKKMIQEMGAGDAITVKTKILEFENEKNVIEKTVNNLKSSVQELESEIIEKKKNIVVLDDELLLESFALYKPKFHFLTSQEYKDKLDKIRNEQKDLIKQNRAVIGNQNWTVNNSVREGRKMVNDMTKLLLRSFNNECDYCVENVKFNTIETHINRIEKSFDSVNKLGRVMNIYIEDDYKKLKLDELALAFEYQRKKQEEKEEQKRLREELREQQKLEQEIKIAKEKIAKERKHYTQALKELEEKLNSNTGDKNDILEKIQEIKGKCLELDDEEKIVDYRLQNAKAGYVYIISNIGAFGENVFKIGMTRRLEPQERIDELGDASVPFTFDVHALIFSENAPALETKLHEHFYKNRVNKLNNRKEFFHADIKEIEKVIRENYDKVVDVLKEAPAEQYREGLLIN